MYQLINKGISNGCIKGISVLLRADCLFQFYVFDYKHRIGIGLAAWYWFLFRLLQAFVSLHSTIIAILIGWIIQYDYPSVMDLLLLNAICVYKSALSANVATGKAGMSQCLMRLVSREAHAIQRNEIQHRDESNAVLSPLKFLQYFAPFHADIPAPCPNRRTWNTISPSELHKL